MVDLNDWNDWLKSKGLSDRSIKNYYFYYQKFDWEHLDQRSIIAFLTRYRNDVARAFIKNTLQFLLTSDMPEDYKLKIKSIEIPKVTGRKKKREPDIYSREDIHKIAGVMKLERNKIMVLLNFYAGLRVGELVNLKPLNIKWKLWLDDPGDVGYMKFIGKGNKQRTAWIPAKLMEKIYNWIKSEIPGQSEEDTLFKIKVRRYQELLGNASEKAIQKRIHPHSLRHSCATYLLSHGLNLIEIAEFLGHDSIITTQKYLHIVNRKELAEKVKKAFD